MRYSSHPFSMRLQVIKDSYWLGNGIGSSYSIVAFIPLKPGSGTSYLVIRYSGRFGGEEEGGREKRVIRSVNHAIISLSHYIMNGPWVKSSVIYMTCLEKWLIWWYHGPVFFLCSRYGYRAYYMTFQATLPVF